jgi:Domain of unknown function (DUF4411)
MAPRRSTRRRAGERSLFTTYCIDTDALIHAHRDYPRLAFPGLWAALDELIDERRFVASTMVFEELEHHEGDVVHAWARERKHMFVELDEAIQLEVAEILTAFPKLAKPRHGHHRADAFVIATAKVLGAHVVTHEDHDDHNENRPKIPLICNRRGVTCHRFPWIIGAERWVFQLQP